MLRTFLVAVTLAAATLPAQADTYFVDGNMMSQKCSSTDVTDLLMCRGFVIGSMDTITLLASEQMSARLCVPDLRASQLQDVFIKYLADHPAERHFAASGIFLDAVGAAFPC